MDLFLSSNTHYWCFIAEHLWIYSLDQTGYLLWKVRHSAQQFPPVSVKHLVKLPPHFDLCTTDTSYKSDPVNIGTSSAKEDVRGSGFPWPSNQIVQISYITVGMVEGLGHPKSDWLKNLLVIPLSLGQISFNLETHDAEIWLDKKKPWVYPNCSSATKSREWELMMRTNYSLLLYKYSWYLY